MAFNPDPIEMFPNASNGTNTLILNTADHADPSLPEVSTAEAHVSDGDSRKVLYGLLAQAFDWYNGLATADRPAQLQIFRSTGAPNDITGNITRTFTVRFVLSTGDLEVADEA